MTIATTRCSSTPERSASCRTSMPQRAELIDALRFSAIVAHLSWAPSELGAVTVDVDFCLVSPGNLLGIT
jgi:hypothetical protein